MSTNPSEDEDTILGSRRNKRRRINSEEDESDNVDSTDSTGTVLSYFQKDSENHIDEIVSKEDLKKKLDQRAITDGKFYTVDYEKSSQDGSKLLSTCNTCSKVYKASFKSTSNYVTHLKVKIK